MKLALVLLLGLTTFANAATVAIIDSGMDYKHELIKPNLWVNQSASKKDSPYQNVLYGWNFVEKNNEVIDYSHLGTFSPDVKKIYELQAKSFLFQVTDEERAWAKEKMDDKDFAAELDRFGNFVHGTHVAGIAVKDSNNKAMGIKLLPTPAKKVIKKAVANKSLLMNDPWRNIEAVFTMVALRRNVDMVEIARFLKEHKVDIANGSFGTGIQQAVGLAYEAFRSTFKRSPSEEELKKATVLFLKVLSNVGKMFVAAAPETLFVFAAGNDGLSNDEYGMSPANIKADNTISVAATYKDLFFAPFSNWGTEMVEVAAPGMLINSSIPGDDYLPVSGTSQAAPFVANVAGRIKDANPALKPVEIKKIIMETVDKKSFLAIRVKTGGMVNAERAVLAAELSRSMSAEEAIERAKVAIPSAKSFKSNSFVVPVNVMPMAMPAEFI